MTENKEKVTYYDDGSTIVDMSCVEESRKRRTTNQNSNVTTTTKKIRSTPKEKIDTFFQAFKMMLIPTFVVIFILGVLFLFFYLITR